VEAETKHKKAHRARADVYWRRRAAERSLMSKGIYAAAARESEAALGGEAVGDPLGGSIRDALG